MTLAKISFSLISLIHCFLCLLSQLINFVGNQNEDIFEFLIFPRIVGKMRLSNLLQKTAHTFEGTIAVTLKQVVIILQ